MCKYILHDDHGLFHDHVYHTDNDYTTDGSSLTHRDDRHDENKKDDADDHVLKITLFSIY